MIILFIIRVKMNKKVPSYTYICTKVDYTHIYIRSLLYVCVRVHEDIRNIYIPSFNNI